MCFVGFKLLCVKLFFLGLAIYFYELNSQKILNMNFIIKKHLQNDLSMLHFYHYIEFQ